jgi:peroxiredoxin Q/BCP
MLCDESKDMLKSYQAWGLKKFIGKEYEGIHRISYLIKDGLIKHVFDKVKTKTHAEDVLNEIS